jgi:hypothetical protein
MPSYTSCPSESFLYLADKAPQHARPDETKQRILTLADYWQPYTLADVNGQRCRDYVAWRVAKPWKSCKPEDTMRPSLSHLFGKSGTTWGNPD